MKQTAETFHPTVDEATNWLMQEFSTWNNVQEELAEKGYAHNHYNEQEMTRMHDAFRSIAERLVLEDINWKGFEWLETPWAGTDANTGLPACIIHFLFSDDEALGILGFYVTRSKRFWYAVPLAEFADVDGVLLCEANTVQAAINGLLAAPKEAVA